MSRPRFEKEKPPPPPPSVADMVCLLPNAQKTMMAGAVAIALLPSSIRTASFLSDQEKDLATHRLLSQPAQTK